VAPLRLGGLRGKQSTPSVWLGGTGELSTVGERERQGVRDAARSAGRLPSKGVRQRYDFNSLGRFGATVYGIRFTTDMGCTHTVILGVFNMMLGVFLFLNNLRF
jgi:hypothetical protein